MTLCDRVIRARRRFRLSFTKAYADSFEELPENLSEKQVKAHKIGYLFGKSIGKLAPRPLKNYFRKKTEDYIGKIVREALFDSHRAEKYYDMVYDHGLRGLTESEKRR
ncbi:hypothetical protein KY348_00855 [Candidatus Woesearchaeota archaeon]|nr:hypothetical protein [Candidatus Woesearchaeota archaeon]